MLISVNKTVNDSTLEKMFLNDVLNVVSGYTAVEGAVGINDNDRTESAKTEATGLNNLYFFSKTEISDILVECLLKSLTTGGGTACTATYQNVSANHLFFLLSVVVGYGIFSNYRTAF